MCQHTFSTDLSLVARWKSHSHASHLDKNDGREVCRWFSAVACQNVVASSAIILCSFSDACEPVCHSGRPWQGWLMSTYEFRGFRSKTARQGFAIFPVFPVVCVCQLEWQWEPESEHSRGNCALGVIKYNGDPIRELCGGPPLMTHLQQLCSISSRVFYWPGQLERSSLSLRQGA